MIADINYGKDIEGEEYRELLKWCFNCSTCFSLIDYRFSKRNPTRALSELSPYLISKLETTYYSDYDKCFQKGMGLETGMVPTTYAFRCCEETRKWAFEQSDSLFGWGAFPLEDICFYRDDHSVVLRSISHEAICSVNCTQEEAERFPNKQRWNIQAETEMDDDWCI